MGDVLDVASPALLALSTVASAFCAYQASLWNGRQSQQVARASAAQFNSVRRLALLSRNVTIDVGVFLHFVAARLRGEGATAEFLRTHARAELRPALEAWIADAAAGKADIPNPFGRAEYRSADEDEILAHVDTAAAAIGEANAAIANASLYVLHTVLFAVALFFFGEAGEVRRDVTRTALIVLGVIWYGATTASMLRLPRLTRPPRPARRR